MIINSKYSVAIYCTGLLFILTVWLVICAGNLTIYSLLRFSLLIMLSYIAMIIDLKTKTVPNILVTVMILVWALLLIPIVIFDTVNGIKILADSLFGLLAGGGIFLLVYVLSKKGLGGGDVKFMSAAGLFLGFSETVPVIFYGTFLAAITGLILILIKKINRKETMPLVPFLFIGIMITAFVR